MSRASTTRTGAAVVCGLLLTAVLVCASTASAHEKTSPDAAESLPTEGARQEIGVAEHLGDRVPLELPFRDEHGASVTLNDVVTGPTVLSLAYFGCTSICPRFLAGIAETLGMLDARPGVDYRAVTVSFDERDTPAVALAAKENYLSVVGDEFPPDAWRFLTGTRESILALTESVGFTFQRQGKEFLHPVVLVVLSGEGRIVRYIYGDRFLPFDVRMALTEASEGRVGSTVNRVLLYCFRYDPEGKSYVFDTMRVFGVSTSLAAVAFFLYLVLGGKRRRTTRGD